MRFKCKFLFVASLCLVLVKPGYTQEKKSFWSRFSLKITAGFGSNLPIGDLNDYLESFNNNDVFDAHRQANTGLVIGEIKSLGTRDFHAEVEVRFDLTPRISLGFALSPPIHEHNESTLTYTIRGSAGNQVTTWTFEPEIKVSPPMKLSAYFALPLSARLQCLLGGGMGFYPSKISIVQRVHESYPVGSDSWGIAFQDARQNFGLGFHGNIALEYSLAKRVALVGEIQGRFVEIRNLRGTLKLTDNAGDHYEKPGTLYYCTIYDPVIGTRHVYVGIMEKPPEIGIGEIKDMRKASLNLSGYSIKIGINMRLF